MGDELPHEVLLAIERILESAPQHDDVALDGPVFNLPAILNSYFPNESSLALLDDVNDQLQQSERALQLEIRSLRQEVQQDQDVGRMQLIQEMISDLLGQISRIREKATESEVVVRDITKDIQVLGLAKKNLIHTMTTLKRLQMLVNGLSQLEDLIKDKKYADIVQTLSAVKQLSTTFKPFTTIRRVSDIWNRVQQVQGDLRTLIEADFDAFILQDSSKSIKSSSIADACRVIDILGPEIRSPLVDRYVALELKEYRRIFRLSDEAGQLDNLTRRFAWFRRMLSNHELEAGRLFPMEWRVGWHLLAKFTDITRDDLSVLLSKSEPALTVKVLLDNLALTTEFESSFVKKWATQLHEMLAATAKTTSHIPKSISSAFEPHMGVFIDAQDKALADMLAPHRRAGTTKNTPRASLEALQSDGEDNEEPDAAVMPSSTELFYFYGQSLEQCAKLSTAKPLFELSNLHKKWLRVYAEDVIVASLKQPVFSQLPRKSTEVRFDMIQIKKAALALNTADYCQVTAIELEEKIRSKIDPEFKDTVSFQTECDLFFNAVSTSITTLLRELEASVDPAYLLMTRTPWTSLNQVTGPSPYTAEIIKNAEMVIESVHPILEQKKYLRNFLDKACSLMLGKFTNAMVRSRPLGDVGAEQLLIDLSTVKSWLQRMPGEGVTTGYTKGLSRTTSRLETLLKVIVTPADPPQGFILNYTLLVGDDSFSNFQKILDLKGTSKSDADHLLDLFVTITSHKDELESTSFLSSLDMDPSTSSHLGGSNSSPGANKINLPFASEHTFSGMSSPPLSGPPTGTNTPEGRNMDGKREMFTDFKRFVSFGLRRDSTAP